MMELFARKMANKIKEANPEETTSVDVMAYSLSIIINTLAIVTLSLLFGIITNKIQETLFALVSFMLLRMVSGGYHAKNLTWCFIISTLIFSVIPHVLIPSHFLFSINVVTLALVLLFAPFNDERNRIPDRAKPYLKIVSTLLVILNFFIQSSVITISLLIQAMLLVHNTVRR